MSEIVLFHHVQGLTDGVRALAEELQRGGHTVHTPDLKEADEFFAEEDLAAARSLVESTDAAELFLYPGEEHLFTDSSLPAYDPAATSLLVERVLAFLAR